MFSMIVVTIVFSGMVAGFVATVVYSIANKKISRRLGVILTICSTFIVYGLGTFYRRGGYVCDVFHIFVDRISPFDLLISGNRLLYRYINQFCMATVCALVAAYIYRAYRRWNCTWFDDGTIKGFLSIAAGIMIISGNTSLAEFRIHSNIDVTPLTQMVSVVFAFFVCVPLGFVALRITTSHRAFGILFLVLCITGMHFIFYALPRRNLFETETGRVLIQPSLVDSYMRGEIRGVPEMSSSFEATCLLTANALELLLVCVLVSILVYPYIKKFEDSQTDSSVEP